MCRSSCPARGIRTHASFSAEALDPLLFQIVLSGACLATIECAVAVEYGYEVSADIVGERGPAITMQPDDVLIRATQSSGVDVPQSHLDRFQAAKAQRRALAGQCAVDAGSR